MTEPTPSGSGSEIDPGLADLVDEFLIESTENLDQYDRDLLALEDDPSDTSAISSAFRTLHTIKGTCGFLGFSRLEALTHTAESLLNLVRDGDLAVTHAVADALLVTGDAVREILSAIEGSGREPDVDNGDLIARLRALIDGDAAPAAPTAPAVPTEEAEAAPTAEAEPEPAVQPQPDSVPADPAPETAPETATEAARDIEPDTDAGDRTRSIADASIRVDVDLLDGLMDLVGELVLARNQIVNLASGTGDAGIVTVSQRLNLLTTELQERVMQTRMQPIDTVWSKLPRVVRDLSHQVGKQVRVEMEGADTELDKSIIEAIKDPLTHLVRNAVDHGIEDAERRVSVGKPEEGRLLLRAYHEGGQVNIEIADDGRGIDPAALRATAVERGVITADEAARLDERGTLDLIFAPGFSTAQTVSAVSGRGVGMDVVRTNIERVGGSVEVSTEQGAGTTFRVRIPLTLAIIPALVARCGDQRFAIPQVNLVELVPTNAGAGIETVHGVPVHRLRGRLLPLVDLRGVLGLEPRPDDDRPATIVVLQGELQAFGLIVDEVVDTAEIVVKPLGRHLKELQVYAGATIMGDGHVALILDVLGVARVAGVLTDATRSAVAEAEAAAMATVAEQPTETLLVCEIAGGTRAAIPLQQVQRLEEFDHADVERTGSREVVQHRDQILPLVRLDHVLPSGGFGEPGPQPLRLKVVVHPAGDRLAGIVIDRIIDVVDHVGALEPAGRAGVRGTAVIDGRVTEVVDLEHVLASQGLSAPVALGA